MSCARCILNDTARAFGVSVAEIKSASRTRHIVHARFAAVLQIRRMCRHMFYPLIGRIIGGRDHSTIIYAERRALELIEQDEHFALQFDLASLHGGVPV